MGGTIDPDTTRADPGATMDSRGIRTHRAGSRTDRIRIGVPGGPVGQIFDLEEDVEAFERRPGRLPIDPLVAGERDRLAPEVEAGGRPLRCADGEGAQHDVPIRPRLGMDLDETTPTWPVE